MPVQKENSQAVEFSSLRKSIRSVQESSLKLDKEKTEAEEDFKKLLKRLPFPGRRGLRCKGRRTGFLRRVADWIKELFGVSPPAESELQLLSLQHAESWEEYLEYVTRFNEETSFDDLEAKGLPFPIRRFIKAAKRVARANQKLIAFERGFISKEGIKDREWYKHLGVAPGKWLGMFHIESSLKPSR